MSELQHFVKLFVAHYGLLALFILLLIEEAGMWLPLPGDILIIYFGYRATHSPGPVLGTIWVLLTVTAAVVCGSTLLYLLARRFRWLIQRFARLIHINEQRLAWMERWLNRHGPLVIIPGRLVPGLRVPTTVVCGFFRVPLPLFLPAVAVAALIWAAVYFVLGAVGPGIAAHAWDSLEPELSEWFLPGTVMALLAAAAFLWRWRLRSPSSGG